MKTLTLTQPWATLVAISAKKIETRSWQTSYRGPLAIHAAKGFPKWAKDTVFEEPFWKFLETQRPLPIGCVVATCRLVACKFITSAMSPGSPEEVARRSTMTPPPEPEQSFGDYACGRFAWILEDVIPLPEPIPAKGALGLWEWDSDTYWQRREAFGPNGDATTPGFFK